MKEISVNMNFHRDPASKQPYMKTHPIAHLFFGVLLALLPLLSLDALADEDIWKSGINLYIRLTEQDEAAGGRAVPNQHPISLDPREITHALNLIQVWDEKWFKKDQVETLFSTEQARLLGQYLAAGLKKATPGQDIVFALARTDTSFMVMRELSYTAGRAFYVEGRLNIILGDYRRLPDKFQERASASAGVPEIKYFFTHGKRANPSGFKKAILISDGLEVHKDESKRRPDWLVIDVERAAAAYLAEQQVDEQTPASASAEALQVEAARLAKERREMRLEMARLRKEMGQSGTVSASPEDRLKTLDELREKKLISDEEYEQKRKEILNDL